MNEAARAFQIAIKHSLGLAPQNFHFFRFPEFEMQTSTWNYSSRQANLTQCDECSWEALYHYWEMPEKEGFPRYTFSLCHLETMETYTDSIELQIDVRELAADPNLLPFIRSLANICYTEYLEGELQEVTDLNTLLTHYPAALAVWMASPKPDYAQPIYNFIVDYKVKPRKLTHHLSTRGDTVEYLSGVLLSFVAKSGNLFVMEDGTLTLLPPGIDEETRRHPYYTYQNEQHGTLFVTGDGETPLPGDRPPISFEFSSDRKTLTLTAPKETYPQGEVSIRVTYEQTPTDKEIIWQTLMLKAKFYDSL